MTPESDSNSTPILPGATIGILGSGQLGRMAAIAARRLGYGVRTFSPDADTPTGAVADVEHVGAWDDESALRAFGEACDVITLEFENVPVDAATYLEQFAPVRPGPHVLAAAQHRIREKTSLRDAGFPVAPFAPVRSADDLPGALEMCGVPGILKTAASGYDGKGQRRIDQAEDARAAFEELGSVECVYEAFVTFEREVSVVAARSADGRVSDFGVMENEHVNHILDVTLVPARVSETIADEARRIGRGVLDALDVVGVTCIEFFVTDDGVVLINEIAPRPHNSGHVTIDACRTCQFEQQIRAVCGLPLGDPSLMAPAACMVNLLGDLWSGGVPDWDAALSDPAVKLHLYGKASARVGRKMGHLSVAGSTVDAARHAACVARSRLTGSDSTE